MILLRLRIHVSPKIKFVKGNRTIELEKHAAFRLVYYLPYLYRSFVVEFMQRIVLSYIVLLS